MDNSRFLDVSHIVSAESAGETMRTVVKPGRRSHSRCHPMRLMRRDPPAVGETFYLCQRAFAAFLAISARFRLLIATARALPPFPAKRHGGRSKLR